ncbi:MAG: MFS transporter [Chthoniobacteraceae bacterium]|nr:MFS transporter [Chthoniobacteraceae bacterium]
MTRKDPDSESSGSSEPGPGAAAPSSLDPYRAWRLRGFRRFLMGHVTSVVGRQMTSLAVGWEIYQRSHSPTLLGLAGLASALPLLLCTIPAGQLADHWSRKKIVLLSQVVACFAAVSLALLSAWHTSLPAWPVLEGARHGLEWIVARVDHTAAPGVDRGIPVMLALMVVSGLVRTFGWTARTALVPLLVPKTLLSNAIAWNSSLFQAACALGPALCGLLVAKAGFPLVYAIDAVGSLAFVALVAPIPIRQPKVQEGTGAGMAKGDFLSGLRYVFRTKLVISTITLDLFAVLLGGATALLPVFADRLHVGAVGLGWMRSADSLGAIAMSLLIAHLPPMKHAGRTLLAAVAAYGVAIVGFGFSPWYWLSFGLLFLTGAFDAVSVVVRHTLVQLATPEALRGRVSAVANVFVGSSNEIGAFESGLSAGLFGPVASVVGGGIGTVLVVIAVAWAWPALRRFGALDGAIPEETPVGSVYEFKKGIQKPGTQETEF